MGNWQLEVFKMGLYVSFPVVLFYCFNQPSFFEGWMMEKRNTLFPPENPRNRKLMEELKERMELKQEKMWLEEQAKQVAKSS